MSRRLWNAALSITITQRGGSLGSKSCAVQPWKVSASMLLLNSPTVNRRWPIMAPMTLVLPRAPVADAIAAAPLQGVSVGARHVARKAALVDVNENPARRFIRRSLVLEDTPLVFAGFGVPKRFFYT